MFNNRNENDVFVEMVTDRNEKKIITTIISHPNPTRGNVITGLANHILNRDLASFSGSQLLFLLSHFFLDFFCYNANLLHKLREINYCIYIR